VPANLEWNEKYLSSKHRKILSDKGQAIEKNSFADVRTWSLGKSVQHQLLMTMNNAKTIPSSRSWFCHEPGSTQNRANANSAQIRRRGDGGNEYDDLGESFRRHPVNPDLVLQCKKINGRAAMK